MALKNWLSSLVFTAQLLPLFLFHVSALSDMSFMETSGHPGQDVSNTREKNLLSVLQLLLNEPGKMPLDSLAEETVPPPMASLLTPDEADGLTSLLDKLFLSPSFRSQQQTGTQKANDEVLHVLTSKRAREHLSGAMPPINEFCRLMNVQCY